MKPIFLGTAAAEGYPSPFCRCEHCQEARRRGGRNLRLRSSLLVNDDLLVDCKDIVAACAVHGVNLSQVETLLITHRHADHLDPVELGWRHFPFTRTPLPMMHVYGPRDAMARIIEGFGSISEKHRLEVHILLPGDTLQRGRYTVVALLATHGTENPLIYIIDDGERSLLYATDTGPYCDATWKAIETRTYDAVIIDETMGTARNTGRDRTHMGIEDVLEYRQAFEKEKLLRPGAHFIAHHFSHGANLAYEELVEILAPHGVEVAYDGWRLEV